MKKNAAAPRVPKGNTATAPATHLIPDPFTPKDIETILRAPGLKRANHPETPQLLQAAARRFAAVAMAQGAPRKQIVAMYKWLEYHLGEAERYARLIGLTRESLGFSFGSIPTVREYEARFLSLNGDPTKAVATPLALAKADLRGVRRLRLVCSRVNTLHRTTAGWDPLGRRLRLRGSTGNKAIYALLAALEEPYEKEFGEALSIARGTHRASALNGGNGARFVRTFCEVLERRLPAATLATPLKAIRALGIEALNSRLRKARRSSGERGSD